MFAYREPIPPGLERGCALAFVNYRETPGTMAAAHWHSFYELLYLFGGRAVQTVNGSSFPMEPGDALLISPGDLHTTEAVSGCCFFAVVHLTLTEKLSSRMLSPEADSRELARIFTRINWEATFRLPGSSLLLQGLAFEALGLLVSGPSGRRTGCGTNGGGYAPH